MDSHLNLFHHYGDKAYHEDNVTRSLMIMLNHNDYGRIYCQEFLKLIWEKINSEKETNAEWLSNHAGLNTAMLSVTSCDFSMQMADLGDKENQPDHCILLGLSPVDAQPQPEDIDGRETEGASRPDALLAFSSISDDSVILVGFENKLYSALDEDQMRRHFNKLADPVTVRLTWRELYERFIQATTDRLQSDRIVSDFFQFISEQPQLTGFTGLTPQDIQNRDWRSRTKLVQFSETLEREWKPHLFEYRELRGGNDVDFYLENQCDLVGNLGVGLFPDYDGLILKLVTGDFAYHGDRLDDLQKNSRGGNRRWGAEGVRALIRSLRKHPETADAIVKEISSEEGITLYLYSGYRFFQFRQDRWYGARSSQVDKISNVVEFLEKVHTGSVVNEKVLAAARLEIEANYPKALESFDTDREILLRSVTEGHKRKRKQYAFMAIYVSLSPELTTKPEICVKRSIACLDKMKSLLEVFSTE